MTDEEIKRLIKKDSKCLWRYRIFKLAVLGIVILLVIVIVDRVRFRTRQIGCAIQLKCLDTSFMVYMNDFERKLPTANAWNDLLIEYTEVPVEEFHCPGSKSEGKISDYAINSYQYQSDYDIGNCIVLFECKPGWNQIGGPKIFNSSNHSNKGGNYNTWAIPEGRFIKTEKIESLKWK